MTDEQLFTLASSGNEIAANEAVLRFRGYALALANDYYLPGSDNDDLQQEALIGVWKAVKSWQPNRGSSASAFVSLCVRRHLIGCVISARRLKNESLTWADRTVIDNSGEPEEAISFVEQPGGDPADVAVLRERIHELADDLRVQLSPLEARCLLLQANGLTYEQINEHVGLSWKGVDRAITRARWKLRDAGPPSQPGSRRLVDPVTRPCTDCGRQTSVGTSRSLRPEVCSVCSLKAAA